MLEKAVKNHNNKDKTIEFCSFVCSIMIVGLHSFNAGALPLNSITRFVEAVISHGMFVGAVPIFMFTSGYLFYRNVTCFNDCFIKQKKRIISVVMPFLVWSTFYYLLFAVGSNKFGFTMVNGVDTSVLGVIKGVLFYEYCYPLWYLWQLMVYILISPLIFWVLSQKKLSVVVFVIIAVVGFLGIKLEVNVFGSSRMLFCVNFFTYYFTGCLMAQNKGVFDRIKGFVVRIPFYLISVLYVFFSILGGVVFEGYIVTFNERCVVPFIAITLWILLYKISLIKKDIMISKKVSTMIIYTIHPLVGMVIGRLVGILSLSNLMSYFISFITCAIVSCAVSMIIRYIKPINWVITGNR